MSAIEERGGPSRLNGEELHEVDLRDGHRAGLPIPPPADIDDLAWSPAYARADVEALLAGMESERTRLWAEIDASRAEEAGAVARLAAAVDAAKVSLADAVLEMRERLAELEREHAGLLATIEEAAATEAERIVAAAKEEAAAMDASSATLTARQASDAIPAHRTSHRGAQAPEHPRAG